MTRAIIFRGRWYGRGKPTSVEAYRVNRSRVGMDARLFSRALFSMKHLWHYHVASRSHSCYVTQIAPWGK